MREVLSSLGWLLPTGPGAFAHIFIIFARTSYSACLFLHLASLVLYQSKKDPTASQPEALLKPESIFFFVALKLGPFLNTSRKWIDMLT